MTDYSTYIPNESKEIKDLVNQIFNHPLITGENKKWIINGLLRELSLVASGEEEKIRVSLYEDNIYQEAKAILLDLNRYYKIFEPEK